MLHVLRPVAAAVTFARCTLTLPRSSTPLVSLSAAAPHAQQASVQHMRVADRLHGTDLAAEEPDPREVATEVVEHGRHTSILWGDGHRSTFNHAWLRDNCPTGFHASSGQRQTDLTVLSDAELMPRQCSVSGLELAIVWGGPSPQHVSRYPLAWLRRNCYSEEARAERSLLAPASSLWDASFAGKLPRFSCADIMNGAATEVTGGTMERSVSMSPALRKSLQALQRYGVAIVTEMPLTYEGTQGVLEQFGIIERTFYADSIWDTAPKEDASVNDTAYTNLALPPHTDCTYLHLPPALQAFNCVAQSPEGGHTFLVDGFQVAEVLRSTAPETFDYFCSTPLPFFCTEPGISVATTAPGVFSLSPPRFPGGPHTRRIRFVTLLCTVSWGCSLAIPPNIGSNWGGGVK